jgi:hypothetical protein
MTPGAFIQPHGYIIVAQSEFGEGYAVEPLRDGNSEARVLLFPIDTSYEDVDAAGVGEIGEPVAKSFVEFLAKFMKGSLPADAPRRERITSDTPAWFPLRRRSGHR